QIIPGKVRPLTPPRREPSTGSDHCSVLSTQGVATVCPPDITTRITRWSADCEIVGVRMDRQYLDREMEKVLGRPGMHLPDQVDLRGDDGARWLKFVRSLSDQILGPVGVLHNDLVAGQLSGAVVTAFVLAAMPESEDAVCNARPRIVKRVLDEMHDDPARVWTAAEMAEVAGVSVRRLQEGFRQYVGRSPSECLLDIRLERVHADLVDADDSTTVTDVAVRWGFTHTGRFASSFRRKYGLLPSEVLRR
ncbi:AraC family transcriptional regulator, partial [Rhodococcus erythropolis]|uniref:AraC family transcriptional regulator n=1 Tax=Rhodococcus erythropolis TaxID=1833 RepID=UPI00294A1448